MKKQYQETLSRDHVELFEPVRPSKLQRAAKRRGIRAKDLMLALSDKSEMARQNPAFTKPTILIESAKVVVEKRSSASDMALTEALIAIAKDIGLSKPYHYVTASILMDYLGIESVDRLVNSLARIRSTLVQFDFRDIESKRRHRRPVGLINFQIKSLPAKISKDSKPQNEREPWILKFALPSVLKTAYSLPKAYTWVNLNSISQFQHKYTNGFYQLLAVKAGHDLWCREPVEISAQDLAIKLGWSHAMVKPFNSALFLERVVRPALEEVQNCVDDFSVEFEKPTRDLSKHGRPLNDLTFWVLPKATYLMQSASLKGRRRQRVGTQMRARLTLPDTVHPPEWLPSIDAISRVSYRLRKPNPFELDRITRENRRRPMTLALEWRTTLDAIVANPDVQISSTDREIVTQFDNPFGKEIASQHVQISSFRDGNELFSALENPYFGVDRIFEKWALSKRVSVGSLGVPVRSDIQPLSKPDRELPTTTFLSHIQYQHLIQHFARYADDLRVHKKDSGKYSPESLVTGFQNLDYIWAAITKAAPDGVRLGGLTKAMNMMSRAHPVRMRITAKTLIDAIWRADFAKIEKIMKAIFAREKELILHPLTGKQFIDDVTPKPSFSGMMPVAEGEAEAMSHGVGSLTNFG